MPRTRRVVSESGYYHVTMRGAGRRIIFEDDTDRREFLKRLREMRDDGLGLHAWCLMDNHVHLLVHSSGRPISKPLHRLCTSYALYFNGRHAHVGPVFQGRFASFPVETDSHLLETVRYIHLNPKSMGLDDPRGYEWSSYAEYLSGIGLCDTSLVREMFDDGDSFARFHDVKGEVSLVDLTGCRRRLTEAEAYEVARRVLGEGFPDSLLLCGRSERDKRLGKLNRMGLSTRQLERMTGIGRSAIRRACAATRKGGMN